VTGKAVASLIAARAVYAINWLNIGAIYYLMEVDLKSGLAGLGTLTSAFYVGIGLLQIPGGILAAKWGPKRVVTIGIMLSSLSALAVAFSSSILEAVILRFLVGAGMAFVFSPSIVIAAKYLGQHRSGINVGLFNSAFSVGGIFGLLGWAVLASITGWRPTILLSGTLGVISGVLVLLLVKDERNLEFKVESRNLVRIIKDKSLIILGIATLSLTTGNNLTAAFMAYYLHTNLGVTIALASFIPTLALIMPIVSALLGGRAYDRMKKPKLLMLVSDIGMAGALLICVVPNLFAAAVGTILVGIVFGVGLTTAFAAAKDLNREPSEYDTLAISWVNSLSLFGNFLPPLVFSYLAVSVNYSAAWIGGAGIVVLLLIPLFFMAEGVRGRKF
jgi:MFS family permease